MKILQVVQGFPPRNIAGTQIYAYSLSKELSKNDEVYVFYPVKKYVLFNFSRRRNYSLHREEYKGIKIIEIKINEPLYNLLNPLLTYKNRRVEDKFRILLEELNPDIVHFQHLSNLSTSLILLCHEKNIPTILTLHDLWFICHRVCCLKSEGVLCCTPPGAQCSDCYVDFLTDILSQRSTFISNYLGDTPLRHIMTGISKILHWQDVFVDRSEYLKNVLKQVDVIISPTNFLKQQYVNYGIPEGKVVISSHGIDTKAFRNASGEKEKEEDGIIFGYVGQVGFNKGVHLLIEAFNQIEDNGIRLKIYGDYDPSRSLYHQSLHKNCANPNVKFMGKFMPKDAPKIYSEVNVLVLPSIGYENSPLMLLEAFRCKVPVIASNIGGIPEFVKEGENGLLFEPGNLTSLLEKINLVIENPTLIGKFKEGIPAVKDIEQQVKELRKIYKEAKIKHS